MSCTNGLRQDMRFSDGGKSRLSKENREKSSNKHSSLYENSIRCTYTAKQSLGLAIASFDRLFSML